MFFCDTEHTEGQMLSNEEIVAEIVKYPATHVVLTGGEPGLQIDTMLVDAIKARGKFVQVETNGTIKLPPSVDWVTCSPKEGLPVVLNSIDELKVVCTGQDLYKYKHMKANIYYLQPCSGKNTEDVINFIKRNPEWKLSIQTHKLLNIQ